MKSYYFILRLLAVAAFFGLRSSFAQQDYSKTIAPRVETKELTDLFDLSEGKKAEAVSFYTNGMLTQQVVPNFSPSGKALVAPVQYNANGDVTRSYLPFTSTFKDEPVADAVATQANYYLTQPKIAHSGYAYSDVTLEGSTSGRVLESSAPGYNWRMASHNTSESAVFCNEANQVVRWTLSGDNAVKSGYYDANTLSMTRVTDPNRSKNHSAEGRIYYNQNGLLVMKSAHANAGELFTYYVYDQMNRLRMVIPPKAVQEMNDNGYTSTAQLTSELVFTFKYDAQGRLIEKKVPGKQAEYMVYNRMNQLVLMQDGEQRRDNACKWTFVKYDTRGRVVKTGIKTITGQTLADIRTAAMASTLNDELLVGQTGSYSYTNQAFPVEDASTTILMQKFYDTYIDDTLTGRYAFKQITGFDARPSYRLNGALTAILDATPGELNLQGGFLKTVFYYDHYGRAIQTIALNHLGGVDVATYEYDYSGRLTKSTMIYNYEANASLQSLTIKDVYIYNTADNRLNRIYRQLDSQPGFIFKSFVYNELGQLVRENVHSSNNGTTYLQSVDYSYNIRGWLQKVNSADLSNETIFTREETTFNPLDAVTQLIFDTVSFTVTHYDDNPDKRYIELAINDRKHFTVTDVNNPSNTQSVEQPDAISINFAESDPSLADTYNHLLPAANLTFTIPLDGFSIDQNSDLTEWADSLANLITSRLVSIYHITNTTLLAELTAQTQQFLSSKLSTTYFNPDQSDLFGYELYYDQGAFGGAAQYDGKIAAVKWQSKSLGGGMRASGYAYDDYGRFVSNTYSRYSGGSWNSDINRYREYNIQYDANGNITQLTRDGARQQVSSNWQYGSIDDLRYTYNGNQLTAVNDNLKTATQPDNIDFHDGNSTGSNEYAYDFNGNLVRDDNRGITLITYNHLNQPSEIYFGSTRKIVYLYSALGQKLVKQIVVNNTVTQRTDYINGMEVTPSTLSTVVQTGGGRFVKLTGGSWEPQYCYTDHRGDIRVVYRANPTTGTAEVVQEDHLTPFGVQMVGMGRTNWPENQYRYQGKELNTTGFDTNGDNITDSRLYQYDFGARQYDPLIGRWHSADPMMQYVSPYMAMGNDWINVIDPFGLEGEPWWKRFLNKILDFLGGGDEGNSSTTVKTDRAKQISYDPEQYIAYGISLDVCEVFATPAAGHSSGGYLPTGEVFWGNNFGSISVPASFDNDNSEDSYQADVINPIHSIQARHIPQNGYHAEISTTTINSHPTSDMTVTSPGSLAQGQGGSDIAQLFGKYNAGYIADANSNQLFPNQTYDRDKVVTRYLVEGVGVWILGMVNTGLSAVSGGLAVSIQGQEHILRMKAENYLQNGQGLGIYVINVSAPGAFPRAMLFNAVDGSSIGWHHATVQGAPTMPYHIYLKLLKELNTIR
ncbi:MAG: DUF6443 domain-containing protein [Bacteroidales bacterium]|nr:DUF6443 domain-containing protein [Bacteroidales bacterium]MDD3665268.1 DUF6443 domain-containing protein [Bacteroidales bacterium]